MTNFKCITVGIVGVLTAGLLFAQICWACTPWRERSSECIYAGSHSGTLWTRKCPSTVCHRDGHFITNIPCDNETICMPESQMDGPTMPGTDDQLPVHVNPNNLTTVCQKWYPLTGDDSQMDGCSENQHEWRRVCQKYDPVDYPTQTCSASYPGDN